MRICEACKEPIPEGMENCPDCAPEDGYGEDSDDDLLGSLGDSGMASPAESEQDAAASVPRPTLTIRTRHEEARDAAERESGSAERPQATPPAADASPAGAPGMKLRDLSAEELATIAESRRFVIGMIGYPESGKTWFLNRLKRRYERNQQDHREDGGHSRLGSDAYLTIPAAAHDFDTVSRTNWTDEHIIVRLSDREARETTVGSDAAAEPASKDPRRSFSIIDIPGERFRAAMEADFATEEAAGLLDAVEVCHALILLLPAEKLFVDGGGDDRERQRMLYVQKRTKRDQPPHPLVGAIPDELETATLERELAEVEKHLAPKRRRKGAAKDGAAADAAQAPDPEAAKAAAASAEALRRRDELLREIANRRAWRRAEDVLEIEEFTGNITRLRVVLSTLRAGDRGRARQILRMSPTEYAEAAQRVRLADAPLIYVAMSKADAILPRWEDTAQAATGGRKRRPERRPPPALNPDLGMEADQIDSAPALAVRRTHRDIYAGVQNNFPWYKFDFLTAFRGLEREGAGDQISYRSPAFGVESVIDWIVWVQRYAQATGRAGKSTRLRRVLGSIGSAYRMEAEVARVAAGSPAPRPLARRWLARAASPTMRWPRKKLAAGIAGISAAVLLMAAVLFGAGSIFSRYDDSGAYVFDPADRIGIELERMARDDPAMSGGYLPDGLRPWSGVPASNSMFAVVDPQTRGALAAVLQDIAGLAPGPVAPAVGEPLVRRLDAAQAAISARDAFAHRAVVPFHIGYLQLRMGQPDAAEQTLNAALQRLEAAVPSGDIQRARLVGVRAAASTMRARALIELGRYAEADAILTAQRDVVRGDQRRLLRSAADRRELYDFDSAKTPASLNTATIWANLAAARIRRHAAAGSSGAAYDAAVEALRELVGSYPGHALAELAQHPILAANMQIAAVRAGEPRAVIARFAPVDPRVAEGQRAAEARRVAATATLAMKISGVQREGCRSNDVWCVTHNWRDAFEAGEPRLIRETREEITSGPEAFTAENVQFLDQWRNDILAAERARTDDRPRLIKGYGDMFQGLGFVSRMLDSAPFGRILGILLPLLLLLGLVRLLWLVRRARIAFRQLQEPRHYRDRKQWEAEQAAKLRPAAEAPG